jgi:hypothetical protein
LGKYLRIIVVSIFMLSIVSCAIFLGTPMLGIKINSANNQIQAEEFFITFPINECSRLEKSEGWYLTENDIDKEIIIVKKGGVFFYQMMFLYNNVYDISQNKNISIENIANNYIDYELTIMEEEGVKKNLYTLKNVKKFKEEVDGNKLYGLNYISFTNEIASKSKMYLYFPFPDKTKFIVGHYSIKYPIQYYSPKYDDNFEYLERFKQALISINN